MNLVEWAPVLWNPKRDKTVVHIDSTVARARWALPSRPSRSSAKLDESLAFLTQAVAPREDRTHVMGSAQSKLAKDIVVPLPPSAVIADLRDGARPDDIVVSDVGAHKSVLARLFPTERPTPSVISNGLASMGIALPGAIAAKLVHPERKVVAFCGDGGFLMNVQELETAKRLGTAIVVVVLVDDRLGVTR